MHPNLLIFSLTREKLGRARQKKELGGVLIAPRKMARLDDLRHKIQTPEDHHWGGGL